MSLFESKYHQIKHQIKEYPKAVYFNERFIETALRQEKITPEQADELRAYNKELLEKKIYEKGGMAILRKYGFPVDQYPSQAKILADMPQFLIILVQKSDDPRSFFQRKLPEYAGRGIFDKTPTEKMEPFLVEILKKCPAHTSSELSRRYTLREIDFIKALFEKILPACVESGVLEKIPTKGMLGIINKRFNLRLLGEDLPKCAREGILDKMGPEALLETIKKCDSIELSILFSDALPRCARAGVFDKIPAEILLQIIKKYPEKSIGYLLEFTFPSLLKKGVLDKITAKTLLETVKKCSEDQISSLVNHALEDCSKEGVFDKIPAGIREQYLLDLIKECPEDCISFLFSSGLSKCAEVGLFEKFGVEGVKEFLVKIFQEYKEKYSQAFFGFYFPSMCIFVNKKSWPYWIDFFDVIKDSRDDIRWMARLQVIIENLNFSYEGVLKRKTDISPLVNFLVMYKPKKLIPIVKILSILESINSPMVRLVDYFSLVGQPLPFAEKKYIKWLLQEYKEKRKFPDFVRTNLDQIYYRILKENKEVKEKSIEKMVKTLQKKENIIAKHIGKDPESSTGRQYAKNVYEASMLFANQLVKIFEQKYEGRISRLIQKITGLDERGAKELWKDELFMDSFDLFRESVQMAEATRINKEEARELITHFSKKNTIPFKKYPDAYPFSLPENQGFIKSVFGSINSANAKKWFSENRKDFVVGGESNIPILIENHLRVIRENIWPKLGETFIPVGTEKLLRTAKSIIEARSKDKENIILELKHEIEEIDRLQSGKVKVQGKGTKINIHREMNPLKILMMGNWVEGSCLAFKSPTGNFWSTFTNAIEANKAVFYMTDRMGKVIGRVLVAITRNKEVLRFPIYTKSFDIKLDSVFDAYLTDLVESVGLKIAKDPDANNVDALKRMQWYTDPEYEKPMKGIRTAA